MHKKRRGKCRFGLQMKKTGFRILELNPLLYNPTFELAVVTFGSWIVTPRFPFIWSSTQRKETWEKAQIFYTFQWKGLNCLDFETPLQSLHLFWIRRKLAKDSLEFFLPQPPFHNYRVSKKTEFYRIEHLRICHEYQKYFFPTGSRISKGSIW